MDFNRYGKQALPHLSSQLEANQVVMARVGKTLVAGVRGGKRLLVFGSGHSSVLAFEVYHRAGGPSFVQPLVADYLLPTAGPPVVRVMERTAGAANFLLSRAQAEPGEMIWMMSQSGINAAGVDMALAAKKAGLTVVGWTSRSHSQAVASRHASGKRLFEVCDEVIDLGGVKGDAALEIAPDVRAGPLSTLTAVFLAHSLLVEVCGALESSGHRCVYTSVNTPEGELRNVELEKAAAVRDWLLR